MTPLQHLDEARKIAEDYRLYEGMDAAAVGAGILHVLIALAAADPAITGEVPPALTQKWQESVTEAVNKQPENGE